MIRTLLILILLSGFTSQIIAQERPEDVIDWTGMEQALDRASVEDKLVLINVYADWCPYCQRMHDEVYPDETVGNIINKLFIPVRINTESEGEVSYLGNEFTEAEFAGALGYSSVPTTYFMNQNGEVVGQQPGYLSADIFSRLLEYVGSGAYEEVSFEEFEME